MSEQSSETQPSMFSLPEPHAKPSPSLASVEGLTTNAGTSRSCSANSSKLSGQGGLFGKTSPASSPTGITLLDASSLDSLALMLPYGLRSTDGGGVALSLDPCMAWPGVYSTPNFSECPNAVKESSLSGILATGDVPRKYYLSPKACRGILRRAERRNKELPARLKAALEAVAFRVPSEREREADRPKTEKHSFPSSCETAKAKKAEEKGH